VIRFGSIFFVPIGFVNIPCDPAAGARLYDPLAGARIQLNTKKAKGSSHQEPVYRILHNGQATGSYNTSQPKRFYRNSHNKPMNRII
jgi:hypothetical protein